MPDLQKRSQAVESELHSLEMAVVDETRYLKLAENLAGFRTKLRVRAQTLDVRERQQSPLLSFFQSTSEVRALPSAGITRPQRSYGPLRLPGWPSSL